MAVDCCMAPTGESTPVSRTSLGISLGWTHNGRERQQMPGGKLVPVTLREYHLAAEPMSSAMSGAADEDLAITATKTDLMLLGILASKPIERPSGNGGHNDFETLDATDGLGRLNVERLDITGL